MYLVEKKELLQISNLEKLPLNFIEKEIKNHHVCILRNIKRSIKPIIVGRKFRCKYNLNLGVSTEKTSIKCELQKLSIALKFDADTVMDLSVGKNRDATRRILIEHSQIPFGTVPIYTMVDTDEDIKKITKSFIIETIERQCEEGVDFMTIHAGLKKRMIPYIKKRLCGVVSRGGSMILRYIIETGRENPFYEYYDDIIKILKKYRVAISIGDGLRPGCIYDATDKAQVEELKVIGELNMRARRNGVFTMIEGPGHVPINEIKENVDIAIKHTSDAPLYFLGPLVTDIAMGYDHINAAIGSAMAGYFGVSLLCAVGPTEHIGLPTPQDIRQECVVFSLVKHAVNLAKGFKDEFERDKNISIARKKFDWNKQFEFSIDPEYAKARFKQLNKNIDKYCSMCGEKFCAMRNSSKVFK
ncbi:MAG: phosphomethylpyrimidine synthase ThiC [Elusimicrobiales bacterium]|nr:phosphomethylpyrimidine synthase ThiC [Elusimicrobiales bacterium]